MIYWWGEAKKSLMSRKPDVQRALAFDEVIPSAGSRDDAVDREDGDSSSEDDRNMVYEDALKEVSVSDYGIVQALLQIAQRSLQTLKQDCEDLNLRRSRLENALEQQDATTANVTCTPGRVGVKFVRYLNREEHFFSSSLGERTESAWIASAKGANQFFGTVKQMSTSWRFLIPVITPWFLCILIGVFLKLRRKIR